jgi:hypothetical protein
MESRVERKLCREIDRLIEERDEEFLSYVGKEEEKEVRTRDIEFAKQLKALINYLVTARKLSELRMYKWFENHEYGCRIRLTATGMKISMSRKARSA